MVNDMIKRLGTLPPTHTTVLVATVLLVTAMALLRLAGDWSSENITVAAALLLFDIGIGVEVLKTGKGLEESRQERRAYDVLAQELETVERRCSGLASAIGTVERELHDAEAEDSLRRALDFDVIKKRKWAAELALYGYYNAVSANTGSTRIGANGRKAG